MKKKYLLLLFLFIAANVFSQTVYITKTGAKYHTQECRYLKNSAIGIELGAAVERGYEACKVCKPPALKTESRSREIQSAEDSAAERKTVSSVRCSGRTKKGGRCKRMTTNASGRCYQH